MTHLTDKGRVARTHVTPTTRQEDTRRARLTQGHFTNEAHQKAKTVRKGDRPPRASGTSQKKPRGTPSTHWGRGMTQVARQRPAPAPSRLDTRTHAHGHREAAWGPPMEAAHPKTSSKMPSGCSAEHGPAQGEAPWRSPITGSHTAGAPRDAPSPVRAALDPSGGSRGALTVGNSPRCMLAISAPFHTHAHVHM